MRWTSSHDLNAKRGPIACTSDQLTLFQRPESAGSEGLHRSQVVEYPPWRKALGLPLREASPSNPRRKFPIVSSSAEEPALVLALHLNQPFSVGLDVAIPSLRFATSTRSPDASKRPDSPSVVCTVAC